MPDRTYKTLYSPTLPEVSVLHRTSPTPVIGPTGFGLVRYDAVHSLFSEILSIMGRA